MQDDELIALYFSRSETAIAETKQQYGTYCYSIAYHILSHPEDAEECENDTYWKAWNAIPTTRPRQLKSFLGKITRNIALHVWEHQHAEKRGGTTMALVLEELSECIPLNGYTVSMRGNGAWINVAEWTDGNYSYSITIEHGISMEALEGLISEVQ